MHHDRPRDQHSIESVRQWGWPCLNCFGVFGHKCNSRTRQPERGNLKKADWASTSTTRLRVVVKFYLLTVEENETKYFGLRRLCPPGMILSQSHFFGFGTLYKPMIVFSLTCHRQDQPAGTPRKKQHRIFWNKPQLCKEFWMNASMGTSADLAAHTVGVLESVSSTSQWSQFLTLQIYCLQKNLSLLPKADPMLQPLMKDPLSSQDDTELMSSLKWKRAVLDDK